MIAINSEKDDDTLRKTHLEHGEGERVRKRSKMVVMQRVRPIEGRSVVILEGVTRTCNGCTL